jgi:hypothetical protein
MVLAVNLEANARNQAAYAAKSYRSKYPGAPLRVFRSDNFHHYFVVADPYYSQPDKVAEFSNSIRPITALIDLTSVPPLHGEELDLAELLLAGSDMSQIHTLVSFENVLTLRHPELSIITIEQNQETLALTVVLPADKQNSDLSALRRDLGELPFHQTQITIDFRQDDGSRRGFGDNVFAIFGRQRRPPPIRQLRHVIEDDERWYPQFAEAAAGNLSKHDFPFAPDGQREVFLPSAERELPDLRNYFLLYDRVLLEVPLLSNYLELEGRLALGVNDLADAAARGRLRLLVTQPEERLPLHLLQAVQERTQNAIIGRRAASVFAMATYAARAESIEKLGALKGTTGFVGKAIAHATGIDRGTIERIIFEPIASRYRALEALRNNDLKALPNDMGRDTWALVQSLVANPAMPNLELEFLISGLMVSGSNLFETELAIANPRSPLLFPAHVLSTSYAMYDGPLAPALARVGTTTPNNLMVYPEGPLFEFSEQRGLGELLDLVEPGQSAAIAHSIFSDLARLPEDQRSQRILQINDILHDLGAVPSGHVVGGGMIGRYAKIIVDALALFIPILSVVAGGLGLADETIAWYRDAARIKKLGEDMARSRQQVELLSRVRKVAWLSEKKIKQ